MIKIQNIRWFALILGTVCAVLGGLGVHVVLQQTLHVPHPTDYPADVWLEQIDQATIVVGLLLLLSWSAPTLGKATFLVRWLVLFALYAMLRETLRGALMEGVVTTAYAFPLLSLLPKLLGFLVLTALCVIVQPKVPALWQKIFGAAVIYSFTAFLAQPAIAYMLKSPLDHLAYLQHEEVYGMPYGLHVLVPAYITFIEPVIACVLCAALVWKHLSVAPGGRWISFIVLMLLIRRHLLPPFIYAIYQPQRRATAFVSAGQFSLETAALAILAALTWKFSGALTDVRG